MRSHEYSPEPVFRIFAALPASIAGDEKFLNDLLNPPFFTHET